MALLQVSEVATQLGVTAKQVRRLGISREIDYVARGVVDSQSVAEFLVRREANRRRAWSSATAWAAIDTLSGITTTSLGASQLHRLNKRLNLISAEQLVALARNRSVRHKYIAHTSVVDSLRAAIADSSQAEVALGLAGTNNISGYVTETQLDNVVDKFALIESREGNAALHVVQEEDQVTSQNILVATALDLAESLNSRERSIGLEALSRALADLRG